NSDGKIVGMIFSGKMSKGFQQLTWNAGNTSGNTGNSQISGGIYFIKAEGEQFSAVAKVVKL
ncbi:MAG: hypothetical protein NT004_17085, partial [Bacteroidetes bacterium]|nr:hypothetical protein [Bacteroidota bacterium]